MEEWSCETQPGVSREGFLEEGALTVVLEDEKTDQRDKGHFLVKQSLLLDPDQFKYCTL